MVDTPSSSSEPAAPSGNGQAAPASVPIVAASAPAVPTSVPSVPASAPSGAAAAAVEPELPVGHYAGANQSLPELAERVHVTNEAGKTVTVKEHYQPSWNHLTTGHQTVAANRQAYKHLGWKDRIRERVRQNWNKAGIGELAIRGASVAGGSYLFLDGASKSLKYFTNSPTGRDAAGNPIGPDSGTLFTGLAELGTGAALAVGGVLVGGKNRAIHGKMVPMWGFWR